MRRVPGPRRPDGSGGSPAHAQRLPPPAVALDPLVRPARSVQHQAGPEPLKQFSRPHPAGPGGQLGPQPAPCLVARARPGPVRHHGERPYPGPEVVFHGAALALPPDDDTRRAEQALDPCRQLPWGHPVHLHFPVARCYLLLQRTGACSTRADAWTVIPSGIRGPSRAARSRPPRPRASRTSRRSSAAGPGPGDVRDRLLDAFGPGPERVAAGRPRTPPATRAPVGRARPKLSSGRGENPSDQATGRPLRRSARSHMRATSRWLVNRIFPMLGVAEAQRPRTGGSAPAPGGGGRLRSAVNRTGTRPPLARSWPVPWLPPAGGTGEATTCSRPKPGAGPAVVAGGPAAVLHPGAGQRLLPVPPEEVPVEAGRDVVPRQGLVLGPGRGGPPRPARAPRRPAPPPTGRGRTAPTTPGRSPRPARPAR